MAGRATGFCRTVHLGPGRHLERGCAGLVGQQRGAVTIGTRTSLLAEIEIRLGVHRRRHRAKGKIDDAVAVQRVRQLLVTVLADNLTMPIGRLQVILVSTYSRLRGLGLALGTKRRRGVQRNRVAVARRAGHWNYIQFPINMLSCILPRRLLCRRIEGRNHRAVALGTVGILRMLAARRGGMASGAACVVSTVNHIPNWLALVTAAGFGG